MAIVCGVFIKKFPKNYILIFLGMVAGTALAYLFGTVWFVIEMECTVAYALTVCVVPFILGDLIKIVIALVAGQMVRARLVKAGLIA